MSRADVKTGTIHVTNTNQVLATTGVGSCIVTVLYDPVTKVAGMSHAMLPVMKKADDPNPLRYADAAIAKLIADMQIYGVKVENIEATLVGGAQMFKALSGKLGSVGERNIAAAHEALKHFAIPVKAEDTGGNKGRSVEFDPVAGQLKQLA